MKIESSGSDWARAREIACRPGPATVWQQALADALELAVRPDAAGVFLCPLGNMLEASVAMAPRACLALGERIVREFLPQALRAGAISPLGVLGGSSDSADEELLPLTELLEPAGFRGLLSGILRAEQGPVAGWIAVFCRSPRALRRAEIEVPFGLVCQAAQASLRTCLSIAVAVGARLPRISPVLLSDREREVAKLAARGLSDLNIAQRLGIREGTVGRHLHSIFRKLDVRSRAELGDLLGTNE